MAHTVDTHAPGIGARIKQTRQLLELSQHELQDTSRGVSYAYLSRLEKGDRTPSIGAVIVIAERLRAAAQAKLDNWLPLEADDDPDFVAYVATVQHIATHMTALYLLTGDTSSQCLVCGRHEGGTSNEHTSNGARPH
jgi:transcriptional regulator with XRE-family HTH domain